MPDFVLVAAITVLACICGALLLTGAIQAIPRWMFSDKKGQQSSDDDDGDDYNYKETRSDAADKSSSNNQKAAENLASLEVIGQKLAKLFGVMQRKLHLDDPDNDDNVLLPFIATVQLMSQYKERFEEERTQVYEQSGKAGTHSDLKGLQDGFEFADLAYETDRERLREQLWERYGYRLLKHDATILPGYLGHFVAIHKKSKTALVGVRGTSSLEEMLTDCCGLSVTHPLKDGTKITCHEGIYISSKRLADDLVDFVEELIVPSGYKMLLVGHSLGAAGAALVGLMLKASIPSLNQGNSDLKSILSLPFHNNRKDERLRVLAYASPPVLDFQNAEKCASFITTIINNADIIPRCSLSNLQVESEVLKDINEKLKERGMGDANVQALLSFQQHLSKGNEGELLMSVDEYGESLITAHEKINVLDSENLFCPGKVLIMYDLWSHNKSFYESDSDDDHDATTAIGFVVPDKKGCTIALRTFDWNERMISDHFSAAYRSSLKAIVDMTVQKDAEWLHGANNGVF